MELRLQLLESFMARGSDGAVYKVCAYERLARDASLPMAEDRWESTGVTEFRLADGRPLQAHKDGSMDLEVAGSVVHLEPEPTLH